MPSGMRVSFKRNSFQLYVVYYCQAFVPEVCGVSSIGRFFHVCRPTRMAHSDLALRFAITESQDRLLYQLFIVISVSYINAPPHYRSHDIPAYADLLLRWPSLTKPKYIPIHTFI